VDGFHHGDQTAKVPSPWLGTVRAGNRQRESEQSRQRPQINKLTFSPTALRWRTFYSSA
jgi:hypothetical protein